MEMIFVSRINKQNKKYLKIENHMQQVQIYSPTKNYTIFEEEKYSNDK